ncbi:WD repeat-containing protein 60 [Phytophthora boehmeriae]|uniref:WD repeat-containing protein 60 n=1 Tax=Phytophthora boehmeriae TaxID=109152 RepID=A0A8T1VX65_9STRA|nr:WD repeat-containing protein 60 [Phytophthora boehmeriae]
MDAQDSADTVPDATPVPPVLTPPAPTAAELTAARRSPRRPKQFKLKAKDALELDVLGLQKEIQRLTEYRQVLEAKTLNRRDALDGCYVKTVMEYHRVFENGYHPGAEIDAVQYVAAVMDENLAIGRFVGCDVFLDQWERYTKAMMGLEFHFLRSRVVPLGEQTVVTSYASYKHLVTRDTLEIMFPNAVRDHPEIVSKTLGRTFHGEGQFTFTFDKRTHRIVSFDFELDFLQVFAHLLQDPTDLCALFEGARISEEFLIGDVDCYEDCQVQQERDNEAEIAAADLEEAKLPVDAV